MGYLLWGILGFLAMAGALFLIIFLPFVGVVILLAGLVALLALGGLVATASRWRARRAARPPAT